MLPYGCGGDVVGMEEGLCFDHGFLGNRGRLLQCLHLTYLEVSGKPLKNGGPTDCCTQQFSIFKNQNTSYKMSKRMEKL